MSHPVSGIRVVKFSHMVMGPSCGFVLGDLGADVVKIEPGPEGDIPVASSGLHKGSCDMTQ
jgi:crotonobetainyl-CoA:carnitine CoA-transferase CaiB-like acyl-CoA transferase